ncbi:TPA: hypothetical protein DCX15_00990 [bacterium]|nr:hypothetical protein [bacterium]
MKKRVLITIIMVFALNIVILWLLGSRPEQTLSQTQQPSVQDGTEEVAFTDVTASANIALTGNRMGASWSDYNNDGFLDIFHFGFWGGFSVLHRNNGDGIFTNVTSSAGLSDIPSNCPWFWGDYDNNGYPDLLNTTRAGPKGNLLYLFRNNRNETFTKYDIPIGVSKEIYTISGAWADYDRDGLIDLYIAAYSMNEFPPGDPDQLYRNNGDGTFTNVTSSAGIIDPKMCGRNVIWGDYDNDGDQDIFVSNYRLQPNFLWRNNGDGTFTDIASSAGVAGNHHVLGAAWGDYDNDSDLDLYVATVHASNILYRNNGDGTFTDVTSMAEVPGAYDASGVGWIDFDNDGYLDLFTTSCYSATEFYLYRNNGNGTFTDVTAGSGIKYGGYNFGWADYDNDGNLDLHVSAGPEPRVNTLYKNNSNKNHWVKIKLIGKDCNRDAIGARVAVVIGSMRQIREVNAGSGFESQPPFILHFGVGSHTKIDALEVKWPCGKIESKKDIPVDQIITIAESGPNQN